MPCAAVQSDEHFRRGGFTLVEVLIVVLIMSIMAAVVIPTILEDGDDANYSTGAHNQQTMRSVIQAYRIQHGGRPPRQGLEQLLIPTDASGAKGGPLGPYLLTIPDNPYTGSNKVRAAPVDIPPKPSGEDDAGWLYEAVSGNIWLDHEDFLDSPFKTAPAVTFP